MSRKSELIVFGCLLALLVLCTIAYLLCEWYALKDGQPNEGLRSLLSIDLFIMLPVIYAGLAAVLYIPAALIACLFVKGVWRLRLLMGCVLFGMAFCLAFGTGRIPWKIRKAACERVSQRSEVLIQAIDAYHAENSALPSALSDLVPEYLDEVPGTGIRAYPEFEYASEPFDNYYHVYDKQIYKKYNASYELRVNFYRLFAWDCFFYWPSQEYPDCIYGGGTEKIGKWVYVHE